MFKALYRRWLYKSYKVKNLLLKASRGGRTEASIMGSMHVQ